ncbi:MAG: HGGxSTG domain-containing protein [Dongiaceae bacterium]
MIAGSASTAGHGLHPSVPPAGPALPPHRRGRLRNGAAPGDFLAAPRCGARTRAGCRCRQPAMRNGRCRLHGGLSTGPRTAAGRARCAAARRTHGFYSAETTALRRAGAAHCRRMSALLALARTPRTAGHGVLPPNPSNRAGGHAPSPTTAAPSTASAPPRLRAESSGARGASAAGHGVLPSNSVTTPPAARPIHRPTPRPGLVQRTLLGGTALGLGLPVRPPVAAGHGVLPSLSGRAG